MPLEHVDQKGKLAEERQVDPQVHKGVARKIVEFAGRKAFGQVEGVLRAAHGQRPRQAQRAEKGDGEGGENVW